MAPGPQRPRREAHACTSSAGAQAGRIPRILIDLADGQPITADAAVVAAWLEATTPEPSPAWSVHRAARLADRVHAAWPPYPAAWRRLEAVLAHDSRLRPHPVGARAVDPGYPRLLYEAGLVEVDLEVAESAFNGRIRLLGQVTTAESDGVPTWITLDGPSGRREASLDELGQFSLDGLVSGVHRMEIRLATELIEISELRL